MRNQLLKRINRKNRGNKYGDTDVCFKRGTLVSSVEMNALSVVYLFGVCSKGELIAFIQGLCEYLTSIVLLNEK